MPLKLRAAVIADASFVYEWRNEESVRENSFNSAPISYEQHLVWFQTILQNSTRCAFVVLADDSPIGFLRFDLEQGKAIVSVFFPKQFQGKGYGTQALKLGAEVLKAMHPEVETIEASVLAKNLNSHNAFLKAGFEHVYSVYHLKL